MPVMDGFEVCRAIRKQSDTPVIMITARGRTMTASWGWTSALTTHRQAFSQARSWHGCARCCGASTGRRTAAAGRCWGSLRVDLDSYEAAVSGHVVPLTKELELLWTLAQNRGQVFSREHLLSLLWGYDYDGDSRTVDSHIKRLRAKLDAHPHPDWRIETVWGVGYKAEAADG